MKTIKKLPKIQLLKKPIYLITITKTGIYQATKRFQENKLFNFSQRLQHYSTPLSLGILNTFQGPSAHVPVHRMNVKTHFASPSSGLLYVIRKLEPTSIDIWGSSKRQTPSRSSGDGSNHTKMESLMRSSYGGVRGSCYAVNRIGILKNVNTRFCKR